MAPFFTHVEESLHAKTNSIRLLVSLQYQLVTDRRTDGQTHDGSIYRASIASAAKITKIQALKLQF